MTTRLVTEARPIPFEKLKQVAYEAEQLNKAYSWLANVAEDCERSELVRAHALDRNRSGRTLLIDGDRGTGKTSFLLTLLAGLDSGQATGDESTRAGSHHYRPKSVCPPPHRLLLPILDFDPLPNGMPLHGWLLEPWRKEAKRLEKASSGPSGEGCSDLLDTYYDVFERVVLGWTQVSTSGQGVVEKALAYQEQASGWIDTRDRWHRMVDAFVCRTLQCGPECGKRHRYVFVVAIDDVDLQVEQVPRLLHALRLLHHPNVAYILTGHVEHMRLALELDYVDRHARRGPRDPRSLGSDEELWAEIRGSSRFLAKSLLHKALPNHVQLPLRHLCLGEAAAAAKEAWAVSKVAGGSASSDAGDGGVEPVDTNLTKLAGELEFVTVRDVQYAVDLLDPDREQDEKYTFLANICGTTIHHGRFDISGELTTSLGKVQRRWDGSALSVKLSTQPRFVFFRDHDFDDCMTGEEAHKAVIIQLATENKGKNPPRAHGLAWRPDALILTTEAYGDRAIFSWPILAQPRAIDVLDLSAWVDRIAEVAPEQSTTDPRTGRVENIGEVIWQWLELNLEWHLAQYDKPDGYPEGPVTNASGLRKRLHLLFGKDSARRERDEVERWVRELIVVTAPYCGLPTELAKTLREELYSLRKELLDYPATSLDHGGGETEPEPTRKEDPETIREEERRFVGNALIYPNTRAAMAYQPRVAQSQQKPLSDSEYYDKAALKFLKTWQSTTRRDKWWRWLDIVEPREEKQEGNDKSSSHSSGS